MTETTPKATPEEIAQRAVELKVSAMALMLSLGPLMDPSLPIMAWYRTNMQIGPFDDFPMELPVVGEEKRLTFSALEVLTKVTMIRGESMKDLMSISMLLAGMRLGDMVLKGDHLREDNPLLQFVRHFRNACAHGDRWNFEGKEPRHPAALRDLVLVKELHGRKATWEVMTPRLFVDFLDDIANYFVPGTVPPYPVV